MTRSASELLSGKVALIAGSGPGIGSGIALALAQAGSAVACLDIDSLHAKHCAHDIINVGGVAIGITCDASEEDQVIAAIGTASERLGPIEILVNGVCPVDERSILEMDYSSYLRQVTVTLGSAFLFTREIARRLIADGRPGSVINLISTAGHQGQADNIGYCTAKAGLLNFTRSAAASLGHYGIRVNSLTPTATDPTESQERAQAWGLGPEPTGLSERQETNRRRLPLEMLPSPRHYGDAAVFLASDAAQMITGADLSVDAGALASYWAWSQGDVRTR